MSNEIHFDDSSVSGETLYFLIRNSAGQVNITTGNTFEDYVGANIADYDNTITENGDGGGHFVGDFNTNITSAGRYFIQIFLQAGGSPADGDSLAGSGMIVWNGTGEVFGFDTAGDINGLTTQAKADVNAECDTALTDSVLDEIAKGLLTNIAIPNNDFSDGETGWTGWAFNAWIWNEANEDARCCDEAGSILQPSPTLTITPGLKYKVSFTLGGSEDGQFTVSLGGDSHQYTSEFNGLKTLWLTATTSANLMFTYDAAIGDGDVYIDDVVLEVVGTGDAVDEIRDDTDELQTDDIPGKIAALNDISTAQVATELETYDGIKRSEATSDKNAIISEVDANETKIDDIKVVTDKFTFNDDNDVNATLGIAGSGAITVNYYVYTDEDAKTGPIGTCKVWVTTDAAGTDLVASGCTDDTGKVVFYLDAGTYYLWRKKVGYNFVNPDQETIS